LRCYSSGFRKSVEFQFSPNLLQKHYINKYSLGTGTGVVACVGDPLAPPYKNHFVFIQQTCFFGWQKIFFLLEQTGEDVGAFEFPVGAFVSPVNNYNKKEFKYVLTSLFNKQQYNFVDNRKKSYFFFLPDMVHSKFLDIDLYKHPLQPLNYNRLIEENCQYILISMIKNAI
jgi:hypothetical protein